jgi:hypothetical protein
MVIFDQEAPRMASVYGDATLTIAFTDSVRFGSAAGKDVKPGDRPLGNLDTRGLTLQERVLSQRLLYITRQGLFWDCLHMSASEACPVGIPGSSSFQSIDRRDLKVLMKRPGLARSERERKKAMGMWRKCIVEDYSSRHLTQPEDKFVATLGITNKLAAVINDECLAGIWRRDAIRSLLWHTARPCSRAAKLDFPTWSWYSVNGQVLYRICTPFSAHTQRDTRTIATSDDLLPASDAMLPEVDILEVSCLQHRRYTHICWGRVRIRGLTVRAYFEPKRNSAIFFPRRHGADKELIKDLGRGKPKPAPHDSGYQPEFSYTVEYSFVDMIDYPGPGGPREVLCMVMGVIPP